MNSEIIRIRVYQEPMHMIHEFFFLKHIKIKHIKFWVVCSSSAKNVMGNLIGLH